MVAENCKSANVYQQENMKAHRGHLHQDNSTLVKWVNYSHARHMGETQKQDAEWKTQVAEE